MKNKRLHTTLRAALVIAAVLLSGCAKKNKPAEASAPAPPQKPPVAKETKSNDYFPLDAGRSWKFTVTDCTLLICPDKPVDSMITSVKTIDGLKVNLISIGGEYTYDCRKCPNCPKRCAEFLKSKKNEVQGNPKMYSAYGLEETQNGYVEEGGYVYFVMFDKGKLTRKTIAGKHDLKPGDKWTTKVFDNKERQVTLTCGEKQNIAVQDDDPASLRFNAICCRSGKNPKDEFSYTACYAGGVGLVAEYYPGASSVLTAYSLK